MRISPVIGQEPRLQRLVIASVLLHFFLMALFFIPFKTGERESRDYYVSLVEPAKVSGGGEPAARKAEEKPAVKKEASANNKKAAEDKAIAETIDQMFLKTKKSRKDAETLADEINRLRHLKELSDKRAKRDIAQKIDVIKNEASAKGAGAPGTGAQIASDSYYAQIIRKIENEYVVPPNFDSAGLEVVLISIHIDSKGKVVGSPTIDKSSGNIFFDQSALKAIAKASPLPPPPPLIEMPIGLRFYP